MEIQRLLPELYLDIPSPDLSFIDSTDSHYYKEDIIPFVQNLDYILEVRSNSRIAERSTNNLNKDHIFISHGRSVEWYKVQSFIEKDLGFKTLELAQQPNLGRTVIQKLDEETDSCYSAVIVMTGDDFVSEEEIRARENVLHEIGFFQGRLGLRKVVLFHEEGVNIPSNIHGIVYISFARVNVESTFAALQRELKVIKNMIAKN